MMKGRLLLRRPDGGYLWQVSRWNSSIGCTTPTTPTPTTVPRNGTAAGRRSFVDSIASSWSRRQQRPAILWYSPVRGFSVERSTDPLHRTGSSPTSSSSSSPSSTVGSFSRPPTDNNNNNNKDNDNNNDTTPVTPPPQSLWQQLQTPPNIITVTRMASTPILAYWVVSEQYWWAIGGCTLAAISDYLDGYLAKRYGWTTVLGTYLDPLADKAFVNTLGIGLWYTGILPTPLVILWATKDVMLLSGTAWVLYKKHGSVSILTNSVAQDPLKVTPSMIAKINTTLQFGTLVVGVMSPVVPLLPPILLDSLIWTTGATSIGTVLSYGVRSGVDAKP